MTLFSACRSLYDDKCNISIFRIHFSLNVHKIKVPFCFVIPKKFPMFFLFNEITSSKEQKSWASKYGNIHSDGMNGANKRALTQAYTENQLSSPVDENRQKKGKNNWPSLFFVSPHCRSWFARWLLFQAFYVIQLSLPFITTTKKRGIFQCLKCEYASVHGHQCLSVQWILWWIILQLHNVHINFFLLLCIMENQKQNTAV